MQLPLRQLTGNRLTLRGAHSEQRIHLGVRLDEMVVRARLNLAVTPSPALLPTLSHLQVRLNDKLLSVIPIRADHSGERIERTIELDPRLFVDDNWLSLRLVGHYTLACEDPLHNSLWAEVDVDASGFELATRPLALEDELALFPVPWFDRRGSGRVEVPMVLGPQPGLDRLSSASIMASWLGSLAGERGAIFPVQRDRLPDRHAIVLASPQQPGPEGLELPEAQGPTVRLMRHPRLPHVKLLVLQGRNDQELRTAALGLILGRQAMSGSTALVQELAPIPVRQPYDAPNWVPTDKPVRLGELVPERAALQLQGAHPDAVRVRWRTPPDLWQGPGRTALLDLRYRTSVPSAKDNALMSVALNDSFVRAWRVAATSSSDTLGGLGRWLSDADEASGSVRMKLAGPAALALVLHEAGIGWSGRLLQQLSQLSGFSSSYAMELGLRLLEVDALPALVVLLLICLWLNRWLRLDVLLSLSLLTLPLVNVLQGAIEASASRVEARTSALEEQAADPQTKLQDFWQGEQPRHYPFPQGLHPPFDVVLLHVCSLSWDDLDAVGLGRGDVFGQFDLVFDQFNSVTSYSGSSMLRLMRANCGQTPHDKLYKPAADRCGLLQQLHLAGYQVQAYLNHDGQFDGFAESLQGEARVKIQTPVRWPGAPVALKAFDGSAIGDDHATLAAWRASLGPSAPPQALYYNTITLHDGNRLPGASALDMMGSYRQRLYGLLRDMDRFIGDIKRSGRPTLVVLMPEHGAALRKGAQHIAGLRETPWLEITRVPVAVKLIGLDAQRPADLTRPIRVSEPASYLSFAALLADLLTKPDPWQVLRNAPRDLPRVAFVADNGETLVTLDEHALWLRTTSSGWQQLARPETPATRTHREEP